MELRELAAEANMFGMDIIKMLTQHSNTESVFEAKTTDS
jgi:hypothetical protein